MGEVRVSQARDLNPECMLRGYKMKDSEAVRLRIHARLDRWNIMENGE